MINRSGTSGQGMENFWSFVIFGGFLFVSAFALFKIWTDKEIERQEKLNAFEHLELPPIHPDQQSVPNHAHDPHISPHSPESTPHAEHSDFDFGAGHHH